MQKKTVAFSKDSSNLFFHILTRCNLSCAHCYINPDQHGRQTLSIETIRQWLGLFAHKASRTNLIFLGGEPTLHRALPAAVKAARQLHFKSITIDTNGFLFHDILEKITPEDVDFISFSLDGATPFTNDVIRGQGSFDAVISGIHRARKKGFSCSMIYTVSDRNLHELSKMPDLVASLDIHRFFIQVIGMRGKSAAGSTDTHQVSKDLWLSVIPEVARTIAETGIIVTYPKVFLEKDEALSVSGKRKCFWKKTRRLPVPALWRTTILCFPTAGCTGVLYAKIFHCMPIRLRTTPWCRHRLSMKPNCSI